MKMSKYIGKSITDFLKEEPFYSWNYSRTSTDEDDVLNQGFDYEFYGYGLAIHCNIDEIIETIFLDSKDYGEVNEILTEIPFTYTRKQVRDYFGISPEFSRDALNDPILGEFGPYDRFRLYNVLIGVEFKGKKDEISQISFMPLEAFPEDKE